MKNLVIVTLTALLPAAALAHPGHGSGSGWELLHHLTSAEHLLPAAGAAVLLAGIAVLRRKKPAPVKVR